jgi:hypothetical protein
VNPSQSTLQTTLTPFSTHAEQPSILFLHSPFLNNDVRPRSTMTGDFDNGEVREVLPLKGEHDYHDYSLLAENDLSSFEFDVTNAQNTRKPNFPGKVHSMLSEIQTSGRDHIVSWQPHGRCFVIHKIKIFADEILPL